MLSTSTIAALTDSNENARKCNAIFTFERDALLEEHDWAFARTEATLALLVATPTSEDWEYIHQLPSNCIAVRHMDGDLNYKKVLDTLYTNHTGPIILYTAQITDSSTFSPLFATALGAKIAYRLAFGVTQNASMAQAAQQEAAKIIKESKWADSQQGVGNVPITGNLISERQL